MGWAKFDDGFTDHPKVVAAGPWAELLAMRAVIYAARQETDGFIPDGQLARLGAGIPAPRRKAQTLIEAGLWEETDGGWLIHDFLDYHPSKAERETVRANARERMKNVRANTNGSSRNPDPTPTRTPKASSSDGFTEFNLSRAAAAVKARQKQGLPVKSPSGLARTVAADSEHVAESQRIWAHRDCKTCKGEGSVEEYASGAGMVRIPCSEVSDV